MARAARFQDHERRRPAQRVPLQVFPRTWLVHAWHGIFSWPPLHILCNWQVVARMTFQSYDAGQPHNSVRACHSCATFGIYQHRSSTARFGRRCESPGPVYLPRPPRRTAGVNMGCRGRAPQAAVHAARACWVPGADGSHEVLLVRSSRPHACQHDAESNPAHAARTAVTYVNCGLGDAGHAWPAPLARPWPNMHRQPHQKCLQTCNQLSRTVPRECLGLLSGSASGAKAAACPAGPRLARPRVRRRRAGGARRRQRDQAALLQLARHLWPAGGAVSGRGLAPAACCTRRGTGAGARRDRGGEHRPAGRGHQQQIARATPTAHVSAWGDGGPRRCAGRGRCHRVCSRSLQGGQRPPCWPPGACSGKAGFMHALWRLIAVVS